MSHTTGRDEKTAHDPKPTLRAALTLALIASVALLANCLAADLPCPEEACADPADAGDDLTCAVNADCPVDSSCQEGRCLPTPPCTLDEDCDPNQRCIQGGCYRTDDDDPDDADADSGDAAPDNDAENLVDANADEALADAGPCDELGNGPPDPYEPNDLCTQAWFVGDHPSPANSADLKPYFHSDRDQTDHFAFTFDDPEVRGNQYILISLSFIPEGHRYRMSLYRGMAACEAGRAAAEAVNDGDSSFFFYHEDPAVDESGTWFVRLQRLEGHSCEAGDMFLRIQASTD